MSPVFLAAAVFQTARMANLSSMNAEVGNGRAAAVYDAHARMVDSYATELRHEVVGPVLLGKAEE